MSTKTILIADNKKQLIESLKNLLNENQYYILSAKTGIETLYLIEEQPIDILFLDADFQDVNAKYVIDRAKTTNPAIIIIMTSTVHNIHTIIDFFRYGIDDFLLKPFQFNEISEAVARWEY